MRTSGQRLVSALSALDASLLVGRQNELRRLEPSAFPHPPVQIQHASSLLGELRIAGKDPTAMSPRADGIAAQPAPQCGSTDLGYDATRQDLLPNFRDRETGQRQPHEVRDLTRQGFHLDYDAGGKSGPCARPEVVPQGQLIVRGRTAFATYSRSGAQCRGVTR
jgi:hypothetical protein